MIFMATWCGGIATIQNVLDLLFTWLYYDYMITNTEQKMKHTRLAVCILFAASLAACGGGGGGSTPVVTPPVAAAPTATVTLSTVKAKAGDNVVVTWSSTDATSCVGSDALSTSATSGTSAVSAAVGQTKFTLTCTGPGGNKVASATLGVPLPVLASSQENKLVADAAMGPQFLPTFTNGEVLSAGYAYADFHQDGEYSMVAFTMDTTKKDSAGVLTSPGKIHFFKKSGKNWVDSTAGVLADTTGCIAPRKIIVADFNGDGKPDVFAACHGYDAPPYPAEKQHFLLSQTDGTYKHEITSFDCFCHGASAAELDKKGFASILVADQIVEKTPYFLVNNGGTFVADYTKLPKSLYNKQTWTAELLDVNKDGTYDVFLAGADVGATLADMSAVQQNPTIYYNDGSNSFVNAKTLVLPANAATGMTLDVLVSGNNAYLLRTDMPSTQSNYTSALIQKIDLTTLATSTIYSHTGEFAGTIADKTWFPWMTFYGDKIVSQNAQYGVSVGK